MGVYIRMADGIRDCWGSKYMKPVYNDRAKFKEAIQKLENALKEITRHQSVLATTPGDAEDLWDDYWGTERVVAGLNTCIEDYQTLIDDLTLATENLKLLVEGAEYYKSKNWGEQSAGDAVWSWLKSGGLDTNGEDDVYFNC